MSQKSSVPQAISFVSQVLKGDMRRGHEMTEPFGHYVEMRGRVNTDRTVRSVILI